MRKHYKLTVLALLALFVAVPACDLDVTNENDPDRERALATAGDVESLVAGSFHSWYQTDQGSAGHVFFTSAASFQHSCTPANFGCVEYSGFPRGQIVNSTADGFYVNFSDAWGSIYSAMAGIRDGLRAIESDETIVDELTEEDPEAVTRLQAFGKFVQGLGHGSIAAIYDQGFVVDETQEEEADPEILGYEDLMQQAIGFFDEAINIASGSEFTIPAGWMSQPVSSDQLVRLAHSMKARYMASVARTPAEREAVDWNAVLSEVEAGVDDTWAVQVENLGDQDLFANHTLWYWATSGWSQLTYFIYGMADQSGNYQAWLDQPIADRGPDPGGEPFLIDTEDTRFPQGATLEEQIANPGEYYSIPHPDNNPCDAAAFRVDGEHFERESRGIWRWSYYFDHGYPGCNLENYNEPAPKGLPMIDEMRLLEAEAHLRLGQAGMAADLINETRAANGLNATDASGTNTSCVPRLPDGSCGDLMEMLKWEKRLETRYRGLHSNGWYYDGRGWGDLYSGTYLHLPVPEEDLLLLDMSVYTTGPGAQQGSAAATSVYNWPEEG